MALSVPLGKQELWYLKLLAKGQVEWDELDFEKKLMLYETPVDLEYRVSEDEMREFENELALKGYFGTTALAKAAARKTASKITP